MTLQVLVSCVKQNIKTQAEVMNLESDAIIINQSDESDYCEYDHSGHRIRCYSFNERGVGLSRNKALERATADIILFSDEDIRYEKGYAETVIREFEKHPNADMLLFNIDVVKERRTYHIEKEHRVSFKNCGRYPTYSFALRREKLIASGIKFNLNYGGGARYGCGEDSLFIMDCVKNRFKIYALPVTIGREEFRPSTWFNGYNEKYFFDKGALYVPLYGVLAKPLAIRWLLAHRKVFFADRSQDINTWKQAYKIMKKGMKEVK